MSLVRALQLCFRIVKGFCTLLKVWLCYIWAGSDAKSQTKSLRDNGIICLSLPTLGASQEMLSIRVTSGADDVTCEGEWTDGKGFGS